MCALCKELGDRGLDVPTETVDPLSRSLSLGSFELSTTKEPAASRSSKLPAVPTTPTRRISSSPAPVAVSSANSGVSAVPTAAVAAMRADDVRDWLVQIGLERCCAVPCVRVSMRAFE